MAGRQALVIGINDYPDAPLDWCVNDAHELAEILSMREYHFEVNLLTNKDADRRTVLSAVQRLFMADLDMRLIYFSGHGVATPFGTFLVTVDGVPLDEGIDVGYLGRMLALQSNSQSASVLLLDCCHAGAAQPWPQHAHSARRTDLVSALPSISPSNAVLAACRPDQLSAEDSELRHGIFTHHLLDALYGNAADPNGAITVTSVHDYVAHKLESEINHVPVFKGDIEGRLILGTGFTPRLGRTLEQELAQQLDRDAERHLEDSAVPSVPGTADWRERGYRHACQMLEPVKRWFETRLEEYSELERRDRFHRSYESLVARLQQLATLESGTVVSEGTVERRLGYGAFGTVWTVAPTGRTAKYLAYKVFHAQDIANRNKLDRFARGHRAMKKLDHARIVRAREYTEVPVGFYMDYVNGPNLRDHGVIDAVEAVRILTSITDAVQHAHERDVIHRDIKPENIVLEYTKDDNWSPFLTDFDLAWYPTEPVATKTAVGTVSYAAPEQLLYPQSNDAHAKPVDIYAFGQLMSFCVTGRDPVPMEVDINGRIMRQELNKWPSAAAAQKMLLLYNECTKIRPNERIKSFRDIGDRLAEVSLDLRGAPSNATFPKIEEWLEQVVFLLVGLSGGLNNTTVKTVRSASGRTYIELKLSGWSASEYDASATVSVRLWPAGAWGLPGQSNQEGRTILNRRVEEVLREFKGVRRRSGTSGIFEVTIEFERVHLTREGAVFCHQVVSRAVDALERL